MKQNKERPLQASRRASSWPIKGMFSNVEGRLLTSSWAFPLKERRMISEISWQSLKKQSAYFFSQKCILFLKKCVLFSQRVRSFLTKGAFYFSQKNTEEQNTQSFTETLSQPNSQNVTANISWNALCSLYAEGLLWARNVRQKAQWTLCALWEKKLPSVLFVCCIIQWVRSISHRITQKNRTHKASQRH